MRVVIVNYGMGNIHSIYSAIEFLGHTCIVSHSPTQIMTGDFLILPGVGAFPRAMDSIKAAGLMDVISEHVITNERPMLGICLGMQLLGLSSDENGNREGLKLVQNRVCRFSDKAPKIPHVGFNRMVFGKNSVLFKGIPENSDFYFVHSHRMENQDLDANVSLCSYGDVFVAAVECRNIFGTQFHPELSQGYGLRVIKNFLEV